MEDSSPRRRHGGRRPEGARRDSRGRGPRREERDPQDRERAEREFVLEMESRLGLFVESEEQELALEPMNSFKRRIVHTLAKAYLMETESRGEERDRHVFLRKTESTAVPAERPVISTGESAGASASPEREQLAEPEASQERDERPEREDRPPRSSRPERGARRDRDDDRPRRSEGRAWDYGSQVFPCKPGPEGIHIALKMDGSVELYREEDQNYVVAHRVVTARQFRIRQGQIVQPGEPGW